MLVPRSTKALKSELFFEFLPSLLNLLPQLLCPPALTQEKWTTIPQRLRGRASCVCVCVRSCVCVRVRVCTQVWGHWTKNTRASSPESSVLATSQREDSPRTPGDEHKGWWQETFGISQACPLNTPPTTQKTALAVPLSQILSLLCTSLLKLNSK